MRAEDSATEKMPQKSHYLRAALPRLRLATLPTPLEPARRLSEALGGPQLWVKQDDLTGFGGGSNKVRALEFLAGNAGSGIRRSAWR